MALRGRLPDVDVVDVLHMVSLARKTGVVRFSDTQGGVARTAALYFRDGRPVAAETDELIGERALGALCSWETGSFEYRDGATSMRENLVEPLEMLVAQAAAAMMEWREIRGLLPADSAAVSMADTLPRDVVEVRLDRDDWSLLAGMSSPQTVATLSQRIGGGLPAYRRLRRLVADGLLRVEN